jgi:type IV pilus assembly protein PilN
MIRINLLPKKVHNEVIRSDLLLFCFLLVAALAVGAGVYFNNLREITQLKTELSKTKQSIASMEKFYKEYLSLEKQKQEMSTRITIIEKIKEGRAMAARIVYDLPSLVKESVWLKRFKKDEDRFDLEGRALENESVADFVEKLSKIPYAKNVELKNVEDVTEEGVLLKKFVVTGNLSL